MLHEQYTKAEFDLDGSRKAVSGNYRSSIGHYYNDAFEGGDYWSLSPNEVVMRGNEEKSEHGIDFTTMNRPHDQYYKSDCNCWRK